MLSKTLYTYNNIARPYKPLIKLDAYIDLIITQVMCTAHLCLMETLPCTSYAAEK